MKNLMVLVTALTTWFLLGYAVAFGTNNLATEAQFGGFRHGWAGDMSGGLVASNNASMVSNRTEDMYKYVAP